MQWLFFRKERLSYVAGRRHLATVHFFFFFFDSVLPRWQPATSRIGRMAQLLLDEWEFGVGCVLGVVHKFINASRSNGCAEGKSCVSFIVVLHGLANKFCIFSCRLVFCTTGRVCGELILTSCWLPLKCIASQIYDSIQIEPKTQGLIVRFHAL